MKLFGKSAAAALACTAICAAIHPAVAQQAAGDPSPSAAAPVTAPAPAAAPASVRAKASAQAEAGEPRANTSSAKARASVVDPKASAKSDRLDLGTATVTGDREQPKVMYIVPWKSSTIGDLAGKPMNSLVDEILAPVDRDVFKREVMYYQAVQSDASQNGASAKPSPQGEK